MAIDPGIAVGVAPDVESVTRGVASFVRRHPAALAGFVAFAVMAPLAWRYGFSYDGINMKIVAMSIARHHTPFIRQTADPYRFNTPYSSYGIGLSLVMAPLFLIGDLVSNQPGQFMHLANPLLFGVTCAVAVEILRRRHCSSRTIWLTIAVLIVCSPLLAYAITDFSEPGVALMVALIVLALDGISRGTPSAPLGAGVAVGGAVLFRTDSLVLIAIPVAVAVAVLVHGRRSQLILFGAGALPAALIWCWYNAGRFGSPFSMGYHDQTFSHPLLSGLYGMALSPGRGVFTYAPILLVGRLLWYARWWAWYGGDVWGPRFMVPILPVFVPLVAIAFERWRKSRWVFAAAIATVVIGLSGAWATLHPASAMYHSAIMPHGSSKEVMAAVTSHEWVKLTDGRMFDWSYFLFQV
jgi:hypothetical protein